MRKDHFYAFAIGTAIVLFIPTVYFIGFMWCGMTIFIGSNCQSRYLTEGWAFLFGTPGPGLWVNIVTLMAVLIVGGFFAAAAVNAILTIFNTGKKPDAD